LERLNLGGPAVVWRYGTVTALIDESPHAKTIELDVPGWPGHAAGQHVDVRLTAEDGYQTQRSYSIASAPEDSIFALTVERIDDGEVSPYLRGSFARAMSSSCGARSGATSPGASTTAAPSC
jgi:ferredoxin-NADP reductase